MTMLGILKLNGETEWRLNLNCIITAPVPIFEISMLHPKVLNEVLFSWFKMAYVDKIDSLIPK